MNIWNTVFLVLILLLAVVGVFYAGQEMKIRNEWGKAIVALEKKIPEAEKKVEDVLAGSAPTKKTDDKTFAEMGLEELKAKLQLMVFERKKAWFGCQPGSINAEGTTLAAQPLGGDKPPTAADKLRPVTLVEVKLMITEPKNDNDEVLAPDGLAGVVYLFDEGPERVGGSFLGRFTVKGIDKSQVGYQVTLNSANELTEDEVEQIKKSTKSTWAMYLTVPIDRHDGIFDRVTEEELEALIPNKETRKEFENPDRLLRDFDMLLSAAFQRRVQLQRDIESTNAQIASLKQASEISQQEQDSLRQDIELTKKQVAEMEVQRKAVADKLQELEEEISKIREDSERQQKHNEQLVSLIAKYQLQATEAINKKIEEAAVK